MKIQIGLPRSVWKQLEENRRELTENAEAAKGGLKD